MNLKAIKRKVDRLESDYRLAKKEVKKERAALKKVKQELKAAEEAQSIIQLCAQSVQQQVHSQVAEIVSQCLDLVFENPYQFKIKFDRKRGKTEARTVFIRNGKERNPMYGSGLGVGDVASFALRLACLILARPVRRRILLLDEPFKMLSKDCRPRVKTMLETLSEKLEVQIVMVTHDEEFQIGKIIDLT